MNFLNKKAKLIVVLILITMTISLCYTGITIFASKSDLRQLPPGSKFLTKEEINELADSNEHKIASAKTKKRLEDAWSDISKTYNISDISYTRITLDELSAGLEKINSNFSGEEFSQAFDKTYKEMMKQMKKGCTKPIIFIKNDATEIIMGTKDQYGNNIAVKTKKTSAVWEDVTKETKKGKPILKMEDIKLD